MSKQTCICGSVNVNVLFFSGSYKIAQCLRCHQVRTITPQGTPRVEEYSNADISIYLEKEDMFRGLFRNMLGFIKQFASSGTLLDIGAGVGLLVREAQKSGYEVIGFEPSKSAVAAAKKYFNTTLIAKEFTKKDVKKPVDIVVINHVLEHVPDPKKLLRDICDILEPNGLLFVGIPNFGSIIRMIKNSRWQSLIPDQHRWHFTLATLDALVCQNGFSRVGISGNNHDRSIHPLWKKPIYFFIDHVALLTNSAEAIIVAYKRAI